ncbi:MAG: LysM peptidoglycan-binding domain-containing protein [Clostridiales bacterium]|nr:LysM peptidoglycan-binding domain-containing protein [Clostridiales bacterium]MBS5877018.1 LysM peptidoglycan-binding domain-containing protein [Clostridiales bacterium]
MLNGRLDGNKFYGTKEDWRRMAAVKGVAPQQEQTPEPQPAPAGEVWYEVRPGDTLSGIAEAHGVGNYWDIANLNGIEDPNLIYPGTRLRIR